MRCGGALHGAEKGGGGATCTGRCVPVPACRRSIFTPCSRNQTQQPRGVVLTSIFFSRADLICERARPSRFIRCKGCRSRKGGERRLPFFLSTSRKQEIGRCVGKGKTTGCGRQGDGGWAYHRSWRSTTSALTQITAESGDRFPPPSSVR